MKNRQWINVTERYEKEFGKNNREYFECHDLIDGRVVSRCFNTWNCNCKTVSYDAIEK